MTAEPKTFSNHPTIRGSHPASLRASMGSSSARIVEQGVSTLTVLHHSDFMGEVEVHISATVETDSWLDPAGLSGRSDRIIDTNGLWVHWIEVRNL